MDFCRRENILVQGRGSAANSAVCYSLGITAVDPIGMELLFERFLSEERGEWPDIDIDLPSGDAVSYTHLDVYKRQVLCLFVLLSFVFFEGFFAFAGSWLLWG